MGKRGRKPRLRLLIYERMWRRWAWPCVLIIPASIVLWRFAPAIPILHQPFRLLTLAPALIALAILLYTYLAKQLAWVQCRVEHLRIQSPIYPLAISYGRIKSVRATNFNELFAPERQKAALRAWLRPYAGQTVIVVELSKYPLSKAWLKLWFSPYLLLPNAPGFVFVVEDWMALSRQIDEAHNAWNMRRAKRRQHRYSGR